MTTTTTTTAPHRRRAAGILAAITMTAALAACSTGADGSGDSGGSAGAGDVGTNDAGATFSEQLPDGTVGAAAPEAAQDSGGVSSNDSGQTSGADSDQGSGPGTPTMERSVVSTGSVSLTSKDVATARQDVQRVVDAQGGDVTEEDTETDDGGEASYARLVVRVPSAKFGATMEALEGVATLRTSTRSSDDVTTRVIDTGVRVRAQEASLKRVELLLADAKDLKDVIWIESQLTSRQGELDSLKSQQAWLTDQASLSTITVDIASPAEVAEPPADEPAGFATGLRGGLDALGAATVTVLTAVGALLPFAVVVALLGTPVWLVVRRRRTRAVPPPPAA